MNDATEALDCGGSENSANGNNGDKNEDSTVSAKQEYIKNIKEEKNDFCTEVKQVNKEVKIEEKNKWLLKAAGWPEDTQLTEMLLKLQEAFNYEGKSLRTVEMMKQLVRLCCSEKELEDRIFALETDYIKHTKITGGCLLRGYESFFVSTKQNDASARCQKTNRTFLQETSKDRLFSLTSVTSPLCDQNKFKSWNCYPMSSVVSDEKEKQSQCKTSTPLGMETNSAAYASSEETTAISLSKQQTRSQTSANGAKSFVQKQMKNISKYNHKRHASANGRGNNRSIKSRCSTSRADQDFKICKNNSSISTTTNNISVGCQNQDNNVQMYCENAEGRCKSTVSQNAKNNGKNDNALCNQLPAQEECSKACFVFKEKHRADDIDTNFVKKEKLQNNNNKANFLSSEIIIPKSHCCISSSNDHNEEHLSCGSGNLNAYKGKRHRRKS